MAPELFRAVVIDDILSLYFNEPLRDNLQISPSKFEVYDGKRLIGIDEVDVDEANGKVELTLAKSVDINKEVKVSYYDFSGDQNYSVLEGIDGYDVASFFKKDVVNETKPDDNLKVILAEAYESQITLGFDRDIDEDSVPNTGTFRVKVNGNTNRLSDIELFSKKREAVLTLKKPFSAGDTISLNYIDSQGDQTDNVIQDTYGNDLGSIKSLEVENLEDVDAFDPPELVDQYIDGKTITLEFDEVISGTKIRNSLFKVKANGRRQKVIDVETFEDETIVELTLKKEIPPAFDRILVSYRDLKGDQRRGVIEDLFGNDIPSFNNAELDVIA